MNAARILHLEDSGHDAELIRHRLSKSGFSSDIDLVRNREEYLAKLDELESFSIIVSDYQIPGFDGLEALKLAKVRAPNIPFIFVSGALGEEIAIEALKQGATDYVLKDRLERLPSAIVRALREQQERLELARAEERNRLNDETFYNLIQKAPFGVYLVDDTFRLRQVSAGSQKVFAGIEPLLGRDFREIMKILWPAPFANEAISRFEHTLATGEPYASENTTEQRNNLPIVESYDWKLERVTMPNGRFGVVCYFYDITERVKAAQVLQASEERFRFYDRLSIATRAATDADTVMKITTETLGIYLNASRCAYADVYLDNDQFAIRHDWTAANVASTVGTYSLDLFGQHAAHEMREGRTLVTNDVEHELREDSTGLATFLSIGIAAIICCPLVKNDRLVAMMAVHQTNPRVWTENDISVVQETVERCWAHIERIRSENELREANRRKDDFLATLAHELRNPLAPMRNGFELIRLAGDDQVMIDDAHVVMERQLEHLVRLVDDLLDLSRISQDKIELRLETLDLKQVISNAVETSQPIIQKFGHELTISASQENYAILGDRVRLTQVFSNLLNNAAKYTPYGGNIVVTFAEVNQKVEVGIRDNGVGLPSNLLSKIFEMFVQADRSLTHSSDGLGIGLSVVKKLVEMHQGTVLAKSDGLGKGCEFTVRLPLVEKHDEIVTSAAVNHSSAAYSLKVLVADDNVDLATTMSTMLIMLGHDTKVANDGVSAIKIAQEFLPDLIMLDIGMPKLDGYETCRRIRSFKSETAPMIIAITGWGQPKDRLLSQAAGFDEHYVKPITPSALQILLGKAHDRGIQESSR
jgi:signal transduction histidine kinase/DNA-binding response OmpR family regulator